MIVYVLSKKKMKFRQSKIKVEHGMIKGLKKLLMKLSKQDYIQAIIPGRIKPSKSSKLYLTVQYTTDNGVKCIAKSDGVQEVFFITDQPQTLIELIENL